MKTDQILRQTRKKCMVRERARARARDRAEAGSVGHAGLESAHYCTDRRDTAISATVHSPRPRLAQPS